MPVGPLIDVIAEAIHRGADHAALVVATLVLCGGMWFVWLWPSQRRQRHQLQANIDRLTSELCGAHESLGRKNSELRHRSETVDALTDALERERDHNQALGVELMTRNGEVAELRRERGVLEGRVSELQEVVRDQSVQIEDLGRQVTSLGRQIEHMSVFGGRVWQAPPRDDRPTFRRLGSGRPPIVAVVNLKGGVGKTTLTANLGATAFGQGRRVLLADLDYQGSLTHLCLAPDQMEDVLRQGRLVRKLLETPDASGAMVRRLAERVPGTQVSLLATDEHLESVEMREMAEWIVGRTEDDVRDRLLRALHSDEVQADYDLVLLDCPPRLTTACVNALACSDFVLVPVILDAVSADAVPRLLRWLRRFKQESGVCPHLSVLGLVGNKVFRMDGPSTKQKDVWDVLEDKCRDPWGEAVHRFTTMIPYNVRFADAARSHSFAALNGEVGSKFLDLFDEVQRRLPAHESRRASVVS